MIGLHIADAEGVYPLAEQVDIYPSRLVDGEE